MIRVFYRNRLYNPQEVIKIVSIFERVRNAISCLSDLADKSCSLQEKENKRYHAQCFLEAVNQYKEEVPLEIKDLIDPNKVSRKHWNELEEKCLKFVARWKS